ncbi:MAG: hypothetical protein GY944_02175 [bacterium]|nr:hypothetical protein [bacterium]
MKLAPSFLALLSFGALIARAMTGLVPIHWLCVAMAPGLKDDRADAINLSIAIIVLALLMVSAAGVFAYQRPEGRARLTAGPQVFSAWRPLILVAGLVSAAGGLLLTSPENRTAAVVSITLGVAIVLLELAAIAGQRLAPPVNVEELPVPSEQIDVTGFFIGSLYWLIAAPMILLAGGRVAIMPAVLLFSVLGYPIAQGSPLAWLLYATGYGFAGWLVWLGWKQARKAIPARAA